MTTTPRGAPELVSAPAAPETTVNEQIRHTEAGACHFIVADNDLPAPPGSCADGASYIIAATATGDWTGKETHVATAMGANAASGWTYHVPAEGMTAYIQDENARHLFGGASWAVDTTGGAGGDMLAANNLSDVANAATARTNLGVYSTTQTDAAIATAVTGLLDFKGSTDCSANPNYPAALKGDAYVVSVAGKIGGASGTSVDVGDVYVASADNAGGTQGSVGASWFSLEHNAVAASAYTDAMARAAVNIAPSTQSGTSYTAVLGDAAGYIQFTNGAAVAFTIPPNSSVAFPIGTVITIEQNGAGVVTITAGVGVTLRSRGSLVATGGQYAVAQIKKVATDTWTIIGDVA